MTTSVRKEKVAISIDKSVLELLDSKVDGRILRSRSQAMEHFLRKGLEDVTVTTAVILLHGTHQQFALRSVKGKPLIEHQLRLLQNGGIRQVFVITGSVQGKLRSLLSDLSSSLALHIDFVEDKGKGNAQALMTARAELAGASFVVLNGDTYVEFDVKGMIRKHLAMGTLATMGIMTRDTPSDYGAATLDGDLIVDFASHPKKSNHYTVDSGVYVFKPEAFELLDAKSLERDVFPKIARIKQLAGFFTYGDYIHME